MLSKMYNIVYKSIRVCFVAASNQELSFFTTGPTIADLQLFLDCFPNLPLLHFLV